MRKILVPTDFSENAFNALKYACQIFKYEISEIFIVHAYTVQEYGQEILVDHSFEELKETTLRDSERQLENVLAQIEQHSPNPQHSYHIVSGIGTITEVTNYWVDKENIDIVVMGTRGKTNDRSLTFGSNTLEVMIHEHCPFLAIPESYEYEAPRQLLFPTDFKVTLKRRELKLLSNIMNSFRSTITLLYIDPVNEMNHIQVDNKLFLEGSLQKSKLFLETSPETDKTLALTKYNIREDFDMLVMVSARQSYLNEIQYQSAFREISLQVKIPFLVLQNIAR